jgi:hypothetical protein
MSGSAAAPIRLVVVWAPTTAGQKSVGRRYALEVEEELLRRSCRTEGAIPVVTIDVTPDHHVVITGPVAYRSSTRCWCGSWHGEEQQ